MATNQDEIDRVETAIKLIIDESLAPIVQTIKEKMTIGESKSEAFYRQVAAYKEKIEQFEKAHPESEWRNLHIVRQDNATQCYSEDLNPRTSEGCANCAKSQHDSEMLKKEIDSLREDNEKLKRALVEIKLIFNQGAMVDRKPVLPDASLSQAVTSKPVINPPMPTKSQIPEVIEID